MKKDFPYFVEDFYIYLALNEITLLWYCGLNLIDFVIHFLLITFFYLPSLFINYRRFTVFHMANETRLSNPMIREKEVRFRQTNVKNSLEM